jgi:hypothetical protein
MPAPTVGAEALDALLGRALDLRTLSGLGRHLLDQLAVAIVDAVAASPVTKQLPQIDDDTGGDEVAERAADGDNLLALMPRRPGPPRAVVVDLADNVGERHAGCRILLAQDGDDHPLHSSITPAHRQHLRLFSRNINAIFLSASYFLSGLGGAQSLRIAAGRVPRNPA